MKINPLPVYEKHTKRKRKVENDDKYLEWLRKQRSAFSNHWPTVAAHYRTANNSGIGIKPLFSAIPLTQKEHTEQHAIGTFKFAQRVWWEAMVLKYQTLFEMSGGIIPDKYRIDIKQTLDY